MAAERVPDFPQQVCSAGASRRVFYNSSSKQEMSDSCSYRIVAVSEKSMNSGRAAAEPCPLFSDAGNPGSI